MLVVRDRPRAGLNEAILRGVSQVRAIAQETSVVVRPTDLPALRPVELRRVLRLAQQYRHAYLPDHTGRGTTVLTATGGCDPRPAYEGVSSRSHRLSGAQELTGAAVPGARLDVDTAADLWEALRLGVGHHTARCVPAAGHVAPPLGYADRKGGPAPAGFQNSVHHRDQW